MFRRVSTHTHAHVKEQARHYGSGLDWLSQKVDVFRKHLEKASTTQSSLAQTPSPRSPAAVAHYLSLQKFISEHFGSCEHRALIGHANILLFQQKLKESFRESSPGMPEHELETKVNAVVANSRKKLLSRIRLEEFGAVHKTPQQAADLLMKEGFPNFPRNSTVPFSRYENPEPVLQHLKSGGESSLFLGSTESQADAIIGFVQEADHLIVEYTPCSSLMIDVLMLKRTFQDNPGLAQALWGTDSTELFGEEVECITPRWIPSENICRVLIPGEPTPILPPSKHSQSPGPFQFHDLLNDALIDKLIALELFQ